MENKLDLIVAKDCPVCKRTESELLVFIAERNKIKLTITNIGTREFKTISIVPALLIEGNLFCYGEIDFKKLRKRLSV